MSMFIIMTSTVILLFVNYADSHGWLIVIDLQQKSRVLLAHVILEESVGKATLLKLVQIANMFSTIVMYKFLLMHLAMNMILTTWY